MNAAEARAYIFKLVRIQESIRRKGYCRADYPAVSASMQHLTRYLKTYRYTDRQMESFWQRNLRHIRALMPRPTYPGYQKLIDEFNRLTHDHH